MTKVQMAPGIPNEQSRTVRPVHGPATIHLPVWLKYCVASRCLAMVVVEQSTEALPPYHWTRAATNVPLACDQLVGETLMIALRMIVGQVLVDRIILKCCSKISVVL